MTILSAQSIILRLKDTPERRHFDDWRMEIDPFVENVTQFMGMSYGLTAAGYDIRIGQLDRRGQQAWMQPGDFMLVSSLERVKIPTDLQAIVHDKSSWARKGLAIQNTVLEPGWEGHITLELSNHGNQVLELHVGQPIAQLVFHQLDQPTVLPYRGKYQKQGPAPQKAIDAPDTVTEPKYNGLLCSDCGEPQFETVHGVTCSNGHGGAEGVEKTIVDTPEGENRAPEPEPETQPKTRQAPPAEEGSQHDEFPGDNDARRS